jgi:hypothetical protein
MSANNGPTKVETQKHTPLPWGIDELDKTKIRSEAKVHAMTNCVARVTTPADAQFIVRIATCHKELVQTLKAAQDIIGQYGESNAESCEVMERIDRIIEVADK